MTSDIPLLTFGWGVDNFVKGVLRRLGVRVYEG